MIRGIYTACSGMGTQQARMDILSNNLVNSTTNGYKADEVIQKSFPQLLLVQQAQRQAGGLSPGRWEYVGRTNQGAAVKQVVTNFTPGPAQETGSFNHLALTQQNCFFVINSPAADQPARELYTRDGVFQVDSEGYLVSSRGDRVLGERGPIQVGGERFVVSREGMVSTAEGEIDRLYLVQFDDPAALIKTGGNCYTAPAGKARQAGTPHPNPPPSRGREGWGVVLQGYLERSNVNLVAEMANMISIVRAYEANQRGLQAHNELLGLAVNQVGSLK